MKRHWSVRRHGLTIKLLLIYLGMILLGVFLVGFTMRDAFRQGFQDNVKPHLEQYIQYIRDDIGEPPQRQRAVVLAKKVPVEIYFQSELEEWSTDGASFPDLDEIHFWRKSKFHGGPMKFGETQEPAGGLWVVEADNAADVKALVETDPFWPTGLRKSVSILEWTQVYVNGQKMI